jgi:hypothetical protein
MLPFQGALAVKSELRQDGRAPAVDLKEPRALDKHGLDLSEVEADEGVAGSEGEPRGRKVQPSDPSGSEAASFFEG